MNDSEEASIWERWSWQWIYAGVGALGALGDVALLLMLGVEMQVGGVDATIGVLALLTGTYSIMGYVIGRLVQQRARARRDADTIERQLRELERAQRELVQQEKMAAIGRVAAGVAHEVRNPLGVIRASASMVQESFSPDEDPHRACEFICEEIDRLNSLITALLTFSRPTELRRQRVSLDKVVERALTLAGDDLRQRRIALEREEEAGVPELSADPDLISQVVYGLVSNASEALGEGGRIAVRTASVPGAVRVEVADSGAGVEARVAPQIFEPFFTTKATGTGLGLPMAERIAHAHGGSLTFVPGEGAGPGGRGACFRLELPIEATLPHPDAAGEAVRALEAARESARP
jgi:two-component system sensor histidine kinase HydH